MWRLRLARSHLTQVSGFFHLAIAKALGGDALVFLEGVSIVCCFTIRFWPLVVGLFFDCRPLD